MKTHTLVAIGLVLLLIGTAGMVYQRGQRGASVTARPVTEDAFTVQLFKDPKPVDDFRVTTLDGRTLTSEDLRGKVTLVNFWATWCPPCRAEMPALTALQEKYRDHLVVIGISEDEGPVDEVQRFIADFKINFPIAMTTPELQRVFPGVTALPTTFVLDREVRLAQKHVGMLDPDRTERETLALAGLAPEATVEYVEPDKPVGLANAAQAKEIPGIDLTQLTPAKRVATLQRLNAEPCTCGCGLTVARCRIDDPTCPVSLPLAQKLAAEIQ